MIFKKYVVSQARLGMNYYHLYNLWRKCTLQPNGPRFSLEAF
jgi:hypothetical protein